MLAYFEGGEGDISDSAAIACPNSKKMVEPSSSLERAVPERPGTRKANLG